ncbi:Transcription initiation factor TFIID subunit 11 like protein [Verticillium longisporum]|uniref:TAFII28-like protein domain-containing protein n=3 Tax=Verticillium TaxID=1036719 RepID=G2X4D6_VERDV|nr:uncharacterized protein VDAG_05018 [Verticillium dahliae VdLs.17]KAF3347166.1 60S ribosomal protein L34-B [Verticillium dahliae VDG2]KAG7105483.1 Transcription initiation factor TFIID subunit 11 like protein [Verticillium longisporum]KAH6693228.1 hypothetical protein EV126DRAFT_88005 [Verticillium dahliae]EGY23580.1 hypothetical protein VDAG_05018 [Verticillium dahliae VdLs.17]KAG7126703.1 Transcription initiation factor TFIID subunit 11 like protein [Verticillium longisporum]
MASPPYAQSPTAISPPYPAHTPLPVSKKRASDGGSQPSLKRRKASTLSVSSATHPLRQTSFPPEARSPLARSPSVDTASHVSGSQVSAPAGPPKKKRGRKPKNRNPEGAPDAGTPTPSLVSGRGGTAGGGADGQNGEDGNDDDDDNDMQMGLVGGETRTQEQKQEEIRLRAMLVECFDEDQMNRYENWRAAKLTDNVVKRVVNATVSQSVPPTVTLAIKSVSKYFIGELIEKAISVQGEWMNATGEKQSEVEFPPQNTDPTVRGDINRLSEKDKRGPLRPEHLREAWRQYKMSGESGWVGTQGLWHEQQSDGVERFPVRTGGKRIFK